MTTAPRTAEAMLDDIACRYGAGEPGIGRLELHRAALDFAREHAEAERARHRDAAKTSAPTLPPEIEAAIDKYERAAIANAGALGAPDEHAAHTATWLALTSAITSALAAAREAGRRDVLEGVAGVEEAIGNLVAAATGGAPIDMDRDALRAAIAADKARAVEGMRPALSRDVAESLIDEFARRFAARSRSRNRGTPVWEREVAARAALLAALTGAGGGQ